MTFSNKPCERFLPPWLEERARKTAARIDSSVIRFALLVAAILQVVLLALVLCDSPIYFLEVAGRGFSWPVYE